MNSVDFISKEEALEEMEKRFPDSRATWRGAAPPAYKAIPIDADRVKTIAGMLDPPPAGVEKVTYGEKKAERVLQVATTIGGIFLVGAISDRLDHSDRQHDSPLDLLPAPRDRGDEARRRDELVRARPVHARGHPLRPGRLRPRGHPAPGGEGAGAPRHHGSGGSPDDINAWSFPVVALILVAVSLLVGAAGSGITLRRFLRI